MPPSLRPRKPLSSSSSSATPLAAAPSASTAPAPASRGKKRKGDEDHEEGLHKPKRAKTTPTALTALVISHGKGARSKGKGKAKAKAADGEEDEAAAGEEEEEEAGMLKVFSRAVGRLEASTNGDPEGLEAGISQGLQDLVGCQGVLVYAVHGQSRTALTVKETRDARGALVKRASTSVFPSPVGVMTPTDFSEAAILQDMELRSMGKDQKSRVWELPARETALSMVGRAARSLEVVSYSGRSEGCVAAWDSFDFPMES